MLQAAERHGCRRFVNISTDKAADPTSVLGHTKRLAERLTAWYAERTRPGLPLGALRQRAGQSRARCCTPSPQQIDAGGPVTVTHPDVTRFFMTIPEACELTIQAGAIGDPGEVLVLDMGEPVRILDVAKQLVARAGRDVEIIFTGLRPGEKLHEVLLSGHEIGMVKHHPLISHVPVVPIPPTDLMMDDETNLRRERLVVR